MSRRCRPGLLPRGNEVAPVGTSVLPCDCITPGLIPAEAAPSVCLGEVVAFTNPSTIDHFNDDFNEFQEPENDLQSRWSTPIDTQDLSISTDVPPSGYTSFLRCGPNEPEDLLFAQALITPRLITTCSQRMDDFNLAWAFKVGPNVKVTMSMQVRANQHAIDHADNAEPGIRVVLFADYAEVSGGITSGSIYITTADQWVPVTLQHTFTELTEIRYIVPFFQMSTTYDDSATDSALVDLGAFSIMAEQT